MSSRMALFRPAIFGLSDGCMSLLGVILYLLHDQSVIFPAALMGGISAAVSMGAGEFMSDSENGLGPSIVMGAATGAGGILPAIPFTFARGPLAIGTCVAVCVAIGIVVGLMRGRTCKKHSMLTEVLGTLAMLAVIFGVVLGCSLVIATPG